MRDACAALWSAILCEEPPEAQSSREHVCALCDTRCYELRLNLNCYRANKADASCRAALQEQQQQQHAMGLDTGTMHFSATDAASTWSLVSLIAVLHYGFCALIRCVCDNVLQSNWELLQNTHVIQNEGMPSSHEKDFDKVLETIAHLT